MISKPSAPPAFAGQARREMSVARSYKNTVAPSGAIRKINAVRAYRSYGAHPVWDLEAVLDFIWGLRTRSLGPSKPACSVRSPATNLASRAWLGQNPIVLACPSKIQNSLLQPTDMAPLRGLLDSKILPPPSLLPRQDVLIGQQAVGAQDGVREIDEGGIEVLRPRQAGLKLAAHPRVGRRVAILVLSLFE